MAINLAWERSKLAFHRNIISKLSHDPRYASVIAQSSTAIGKILAAIAAHTNDNCDDF
jgi:hypothetical protein